MAIIYNIALLLLINMHWNLSKYLFGKRLLTNLSRLIEAKDCSILLQQLIALCIYFNFSFTLITSELVLVD